MSDSENDLSAIQSKFIDVLVNYYGVGHTRAKLIATDLPKMGLEVRLVPSKYPDLKLEEMDLENAVKVALETASYSRDPEFIKDIGKQLSKRIRAAQPIYG